ncbi:MAG: hypothetical protein ABR899_07700 [Candidatus Krumholzibacteriaceae bacterium]
MRRTRLFTAAKGALLAALICAIAAPLSAQTDYFGKNKVQYKQFTWLVLKTPHFDINFPDGYRDLAARTGIILEYGYNKLSNDFSHHIAWRIPVIIYGSLSDFQQTNVTEDLIPEGVEAFSEPIRKRIVLHFGGSNADYVHTSVHELVHIFSFDIIYGTLLRSVFSRNLLFPMPLWFMEGLAEYYSIGYDRGAEMFMRDAAVFDYLSDLDETDGYMAYKAGQAAIFYLCETYGPGLARADVRGAEPRLEEGDAEALLAALCGQEGARGVRAAAHRPHEEAQRDEHEARLLAGRRVHRILLGPQGARRHLPDERGHGACRQATHHGHDVVEIRIHTEHGIEPHVQSGWDAHRVRGQVERLRPALHHEGA